MNEIPDYDPDLINWRGTFEEQEASRKAMYGPDKVESYWEHGITVYAQHCVKCGRWAKVLAGCDWADYVTWRVTECGRCGVFDSRVYGV